MIVQRTANVYAMSASAFAARLRLSFGDLSIADMSRRTGINAGTLSRLLQGIGKPSAENVLRIARTLGDHPSKWFDLSGQSTLAFLLREVFPDSKAVFHDYDRGEPLHRRIEALLARGLEEELKNALELIESRWAFIKPHFQELARSGGARSGCLIADHRIRGDLLFTYQCDDPTAEELVQATGDRAGWKLFSQEEGRLFLRLYLKLPPKGLKVEDKLVRASMVMWASGLKGLWSL